VNSSPFGHTLSSDDSFWSLAQSIITERELIHESRHMFSPKHLLCDVNSRTFFSRASTHQHSPSVLSRAVHRETKISCEWNGREKFGEKSLSSVTRSPYKNGEQNGSDEYTHRNTNRELHVRPYKPPLWREEFAIGPPVVGAGRRGA
jgi:hypothetical protein